jgi:hypothetical protein
VTSVLHLGCVDLPYANAPRAKGSKASTGTQTTGDVAEWLEEEYHVMEVFYELHKEQIASSLERSVTVAFEGLLSGRAVAPFASAESKIASMFRKMLDSGELEGAAEGAAQRGVNHRLKHPYAKRGPRPSFIDTGLYQLSMRAWVDQFAAKDVSGLK